ncbi:rhamnogalacturonan acetylesterase [Flavobacterium sp. L1I52]|uniref:Rhamnogalacturonan acetylesterase n=1 Tax=Flavobacterium pokkalii TaxID=1940408 RepID=A0ABR7UP19_9FLAO|nr:rhamnogalacturonan acetylesterase [Flavobacterium pokkalii]MBD0723980.1 rhamnogalacturonan acetylesterase [Flavobacterium pokkalii]
MRMTKLMLLAFLALFLVQFQTNAQQKITIYTVGDSTVKNGRGDGTGGLWGWGDYIGQFLDSTKVRIENHALGGTSTRTYQNLGLWDAVYKKLKKGDYVLIQWGHNDDGPLNDTIRARGTIKGISGKSEKIVNMITKKEEVVHTYGWYLRKVVKEAKEKGAIPIVMSPIPRNKWKDGKLPRNNTSYGLWAKQIADQEKVTFIDLNDRMASKLEKFGEANVTGTYFYKKDHTHPSAKGAVLAASSIIDGLKVSNNSLKNYILENPVIKLPRKINVFLIGDSTMANNNNENAVGWGTMVPRYFDTTRVEIINKARGGRSSRTFDYEGLWDKTKSEIVPGDFVIIQFGHNDAGKIDSEKFRGSINGIGDETRVVNRADSIMETVHTFGWYMKKYIREAREKGATPIVMSLTPRNEWPNGKVEQRKTTYVKWAQEVAAEEKADYIDLSDKVAQKYEALGQEKVAAFFPKDHTHTGRAGANAVAETAAEELRNLKGSKIRDLVLGKKEIDSLPPLELK